MVFETILVGGSSADFGSKQTFVYVFIGTGLPLGQFWTCAADKSWIFIQEKSNIFSVCPGKNIQYYA